MYLELHKWLFTTYCLVILSVLSDEIDEKMLVDSDWNTHYWGVLFSSGDNTPFVDQILNVTLARHSVMLLSCLNRNIMEQKRHMDIHIAKKPLLSQTDLASGSIIF